MSGWWRSLGVLLAACTVARGATSARYSVTNIGDLAGGVDQSFANGINNFGQVAGESIAASGTHAVLWQPTAANATAGTLIDLGTVPGGSSNGHASAINASGQVTGVVGISSNSHPFLWTPTTPNSGTGVMVTLTGLPSDTNGAEGYGINTYGQVAGYTNVTSGPYRPFLWTPSSPNGNTGIVTNLGAVPGGTPAPIPRAINSSGQIVGFGNVSSGIDHAFMWNPTSANSTTGTMSEFINAPSGNYSHAYAMNDSGQIVGMSGNGPIDAYRWTPSTPNGISTGTMQDLGALGTGTIASIAFGINNNGDVVGETGPANNFHAFLWTSAQHMIDLNTQLDASGANWTLTQASAINDLGQIIGDGLYDADGAGPGGAVTRGFLLTPVPEPSAVLLVAGIAFAIRRSRPARVV